MINPAATVLDGLPKGSRILHPRTRFKQISPFNFQKVPIPHLTRTWQKGHNLLSYFLFSKKFRKYLILLPAFYLIMWLMKLEEF